MNFFSLDHKMVATRRGDPSSFVRFTRAKTSTMQEFGEQIEPLCKKKKLRLIWRPRGKEIRRTCDGYERRMQTSEQGLPFIIHLHYPYHHQLHLTPHPLNHPPMSKHTLRKAILNPSPTIIMPFTGTLLSMASWMHLYPQPRSRCTLKDMMVPQIWTNIWMHLPCK